MNIKLEVQKAQEKPKEPALSMSKGSKPEHPELNFLQLNHLEGPVPLIFKKWKKKHTIKKMKL